MIITDAGTIGNTVRFNSIGTDSTGEHPSLQRVDGVIVQNGAADSYVYNNLISANGSDGVLVSGTSTSTNYIESNSIGLDSTGIKALKQTGRSDSNLTGVAIDGATNTFLEYNFISGNSTGIYVGAGAYEQLDLLRRRRHRHRRVDERRQPPGGRRPRRRRAAT